MKAAVTRCTDLERNGPGEPRKQRRRSVNLTCAAVELSSDAFLGYQTSKKGQSRRPIDDILFVTACCLSAVNVVDRFQISLQVRSQALESALKPLNNCSHLPSLLHTQIDCNHLLPSPLTSNITALLHYCIIALLTCCGCAGCPPTWAGAI